MAKKSKVAGSSVAKQFNADAIVESSQLVVFRLSSASCNLKANVDAREMPKELQQHIRVTGDTTVDQGPVAFEVALQLTGGDKFEVSATYTVQLKVQPAFELPEDPQKALGMAVVSKIVWPFWREHVHSTTNQMHLPAIRVPMFPSGLSNISQQQRPATKKPAKKSSGA